MKAMSRFRLVMVMFSSICTFMCALMIACWITITLYIVLVYLFVLYCKYYWCIVLLAPVWAHVCFIGNTYYINTYYILCTVFYVQYIIGFVLSSGHVYCVCVYRSSAVGDDLLLWVYLACGQLHCVYDLLPSSTGSISRGEEVEV